MTEWLAVDWGTSQLRVWLDGRAEGLRRSDQGMNSLGPDDFGPALMELAAGTGARRAVICGMAGARQGWREAPYAAVPCAPPDATGAVAFQYESLMVHILPGLSQATPADVMRGEETQVAGFLALNPGWDGVLCLPGTHTKWVHLSAGEIVSFQTFLTGELFALLQAHSVLRHSLVPDPVLGPDPRPDPDAFADAAARALTRPATLAGDLFRLRAEALLHGLQGATAIARLSGLLIGAELAAAKPYWLGQRVGLIGAGDMAENYAAALAAQGATPERADATEVTLAGLNAAYEALT